MFGTIALRLLELRAEAVLLWHAGSPVAVMMMAAGAALIALALLGLTILPGFLKRPMIGVGLGLLVVGLLWQTAFARGVAQEQVRQSRAWARDEVQRRQEAEQLTKDIAARAVEDLDEREAENLKLKALNDDLAKDKDRDLPCGTLDDARRLRALRARGR